MRLSRGILFSMLVSALFFACSKPAPQLPANKIKQVDSMEMAIAEVNNRLITYEDSLLTAYVKDSCKGMIKTGQGFWYKINHSSGKKLISNKQNCQLTLSVFTLDGKCKIKGHYHIEIGKNEVFKGLDDGLRCISPGDNAEFIFPWYQAYGMLGKEDLIPPYTSVRVLVNVEE